MSGEREMNARTGKEPGYVVQAESGRRPVFTDTQQRRRLPDRRGADGALMQIYGHRGSPSAHAPENTLASVEAALSGGADGVEVDVRLTADGVAVCCHDPNMQRVAGVSRGVRSLTVDELAAIRVGGHRVPTVAEVMTAVAGRGRLVLDLKPEQRPLHLLSAIADAAHEAAVSGSLELTLSSAEPMILEACAGVAANVERAVIVNGPETPSQILAQALHRGDRALHVQMRTLFTTRDLVRAAQQHGLTIRAWTVNRLVDARLLRLLGVDAVITDVPAEMRRGLQPARLPV